MIRKQVQELAKLGRFPSSDVADEHLMARQQELLEQIAPPVSVEEAEALIELFGPDDYFGFSWALLHLIETAPGWPIAYLLTDSKNEWVQTLRQRARNASQGDE